MLSEFKLNKHQKQAVEHGEGPLLVIAGAGTGKTTVLTERIKYLITSGKAGPLNILGLTFTEKAAREMEERVDLILPYGIPEMWISTFHAFCDRILRNEALAIGLDPDYKIMTEAETILFLQKRIFSFKLKYFRPLGNPMKFVRGLLQHFNRLKDEDVSFGGYLMWVKSKFKNPNNKQNPNSKTQIIETEDIEKYQELALAYRTYEELKVKEGVVDYADLISNTLTLFRTRKQILARYQEQFKYILIDEFQDTNIAQNELAVLLAGKKQNISVVADDDQAIYRFRGAAVSNVLHFKKVYPKATLITLTKNYRSTREILNSAYKLIQNNNPDRLEISEGIVKKLESARKISGEPVQFLSADTVENEADEVVKIISDIKNNKSKIFFDKTQYKQGKNQESKRNDDTYKWKDFAILVRANNHAEPFVRALSRAGIPYQFLGPGQLFRQPEIKDLISYLKVLYNYEDNVAMYSVLSMDWLNVAPRDLATILNYSKKFGISLFEACENIEKLFVKQKTKTNVRKLVKMITKHFGLIKKETAGQILYYFLQESGLLAQLTLYETVKEERIAENISKFFTKLKTYEAEHEDASIFAVVDWIDLSMRLGESPLAADVDWLDKDAVRILTVHSSKGLEFPIVFLVNLVSARFPTPFRKEQIPIPDELIKEVLPTGDFHIQEERRLFYVGMTRAKDMLYLTSADYYGEGKREKKLSPFVSEVIGKEKIEKAKKDRMKVKQLLLSDWAKESKEDTSQISQEMPEHLSYSQIETFRTCPLQYKYRYIVRIPVYPSPILAFGSAIHKVLRLFYELVKSGKKVNESVLLELLEKHWPKSGFGNKTYEEKMKSHGKALLKNFYKKGFDSKVSFDIERPFVIKITPRFKLKGRIDRIDLFPDGTIEIIDYKTGHMPKGKDARDDFQLTVYVLAVVDKSMYNVPAENVKASFYFLEDNNKVSVKRTEEELKQAKERIIETWKNISVSKFTPKIGTQCEFCEFRLICDAWQ